MPNAAEMFERLHENPNVVKESLRVRAEEGRAMPVPGRERLRVFKGTKLVLEGIIRVNGLRSLRRTQTAESVLEKATAGSLKTAYGIRFARIGMQNRRPVTYYKFQIPVSHAEPEALHKSLKEIAAAAEKLKWRPTRAITMTFHE